MPENGAVRIESVSRGAPVTLNVDGRAIVAREGEMLAAALLAAGVWQLRRSPTAGAARGAFCLMGVCQECAIFIDGTVRRACQTRVRAGLTVELRGVV